MNKTTDLLDVDQLAELCGVAKGTILRWRREGNFPTGIRFGRRTIRWPRETVQVFLAEREEQQKQNLTAK